jgi:putative ABC transport system permease protein
VALSVVLLTGGGLLTRSFASLRRVAPGFEPRNILTFKMSLPPRYSTTSLMWEYERDVLERLDNLPGVEAAASAICLPLETEPDMPAAILGQPEPSLVNPAYRPVSPDYFRVLQIPLIRGRTFASGDTSRSMPVALVNEAMAREVFKDRNPLWSAHPTGWEPITRINPA